MNYKSRLKRVLIGAILPPVIGCFMWILMPPFTSIDFKGYVFGQIAVFSLFGIQAFIYSLILEFFFRTRINDLFVFVFTSFSLACFAMFIPLGLLISYDKYDDWERCMSGGAFIGLVMGVILYPYKKEGLKSSGTKGHSKGSSRVEDV